jgi:hypothetical protein
MTEPTAQTKIEKSRNLARIQTYKLYYESKLACLSNKRLSPTLHLLACKDAPSNGTTLIPAGNVAATSKDASDITNITKKS